MPELPEVQAHAERLSTLFGGAVLESFQPLSFAALKTFAPAPEAAVGHRLQSVGRRGKYLLLAFEPVTFAVHLMQGGRLRPDTGRSKRPRGGLARWTFDGSRALLLTEPGTERRAGIWVVQGDPRAAEPLARLGPEADTLDARDLLARLNGASARLHTFLRDQSELAGLGRRLANEICHRARLSPFAATRKLDADAAETLVEAIRACVAESLEQERAREDMGKAADRESAVHGRTGMACPVCGDLVRAVEYRAYTVNYCATCQTGGRVLADNTLSKFGVERDPTPP